MVELCDKDSLDEREVYYIEKYGTMDKEKGYNLTSGGQTNKEFSEETRQKMSECAHWRGKTLPPETREKISVSRTGKCVGEENPFYGKHHSDETKEILREKALERCKIKENHPFYGKHLSDEAKEKIRQARLGTKASPETRKKLSESRSGNKNSRCRPVYCPELDEKFWGAKEVEEKYGINKNSISQCINGHTQHAGKHPVTGVPLSWIPLD